MINLAKLLGRKGLTDPNFTVSGLSINSRTIHKGEGFLALKGENFDAHDFLEEAFLKGASAAVVEYIPKGMENQALIVVDSSLEALKTMARNHRTEFNCPVIALTGSSGKTTVKEMVSHLLPTPHLATKGNLNNHIGVPLMLLRLKAEHQAAVFELGANHVGEIFENVQLVNPDFSLITNIGEAHIGEFGGIDNIEKAKGEIFKGLPSQGTFLVNLDDVRVKHQASLHENAKITYSCIEKEAHLFAFDLNVSEPKACSFKLKHKDSVYSVEVPQPGKHSIYNALATLSVVVALKLDLNVAIQRLSSFSGVAGRLQRVTLESQQTLIDDSYNANLNSVLAAIDVLAKEPGRTCLILGELAEAGGELETHKSLILQSVIDNKIDGFYTLGNQNAKVNQIHFPNYRHYTDKKALVMALNGEKEFYNAILVKGSRCAKMEEVVELLKKQ